VLFRSIMSEISDVKEMVGTALKNSSEAIERYREIEAKIEELPRANFIRAEITAQITEEVGRIAKMDKRIKCLEQDMIKTSFKGGNGGSVGAQRNFDYSAIERIEEEIAQLHHKNLHFSSKKVDLHVLEELMRHVATREDLRKITRQTNALLKQHQKHTANNTEGSESISVLESRLMDRIDKQFYDGALESRMHASIHSKIEAYVCLNVSRISKSINVGSMKLMGYRFRKVRMLVGWFVMTTYTTAFDVISTKSYTLCVAIWRNAKLRGNMLIGIHLTVVDVGYGIVQVLSLAQLFHGMWSPVIRTRTTFCGIKTRRILKL